MKWYKNFPDDFASGTICLSLEAVGAYSLVLGQMYSTEMAVAYDRRCLARILRCDPRKAMRLIDELIIKGKLQTNGVLLWNVRAMLEIHRAYIRAKSTLSAREKALEIKANASQSTEPYTRIKNLESRKERKKERKKERYIYPSSVTNVTNDAVQYKDGNSMKEGLPSPSNSHSIQVTPTTPRVPRRPPSPPPEFEAFWRAYPRRVGKQAAVRAFVSACRRVSAETIAAGLERVKSGWTDPQYTPHPATWLNRGGWEDEIGDNSGEERRRAELLMHHRRQEMAAYRERQRREGQNAEGKAKDPELGQRGNGDAVQFRSPVNLVGRGNEEMGR